jgi:hypothetical protein
LNFREENLDDDNNEISGQEDHDNDNIEISDHESNTQEEAVSENEHNNEGVELRRSSRIPRLSIRLKDFVTYKVQYPI